MPAVILAIPHGCFLDDAQRANPAELIPFGTPIEPFEGTPPLSDLRDHNQRKQPEPERERFEVHEVEPPANVTRLDTFVRRRDEEDNPPGAA